MERDHCRVALTPFHAAEVLLGEARKFGEFFLGQTSLLPKPLDVFAYQFAHIHMRNSANSFPQVYQL